jgi:DNA-binding GntR family transcriptional regulator
MSIRATGRLGGASAKQSATDRAVRQIKDRILNGSIPTGGTLNEEGLSQELGLSRTPIREALQVLQTQGFVRIERYRGATVTGLDMRDVHDLFDLRIALESHCIGEAMASAQPLDLEPIRSALAGHREALDAEGLEAMEHATEYDRKFHFSVLNLHSNKRLSEILENTWDQVVRCSFQIMHRHPVQADSFREHSAVLAALEAGDRDAAITASRTHLRNALRRTVLPD